MGYDLSYYALLIEVRCSRCGRVVGREKAGPTICGWCEREVKEEGEKKK
jgi:uncharacterized Zn finger protein (UPF0148 family)